MPSTFPTLGTVDLSPLFDGTEVDAVDTGVAMLAAMETSNGFVAAGLPGAASLDTRIGDLLCFFELREAERLAIATRRHRVDTEHCYRGFFPVAQRAGLGPQRDFRFRAERAVLRAARSSGKALPGRVEPVANT